MVVPPPSGLQALTAYIRTFFTPIRFALLLLWFTGLSLTATYIPEPAAVQLYLAVSVAVAVCLNFAGRARAPGELSAYSVFNPGGTRLLGEITAAQFDNEMRRRPVEWGLDEGEGEGGGGFWGEGRVTGRESAGDGGGAGGDAGGEESAELERVRREIFKEARRGRLAAAAAARAERAA